MLKSNGNVIAKSIVFVVSVVLIVAATWAVLNRQHVIDQVNVWAYEPTEAVQAVNDRSGFTEQGNFLFYATQPVVALS